MSFDLDSRVPPGRIVLIRHGETEWSRSGRHTGRTDVPLTADGVRQAAALRPALRSYRFVLVATSPRVRATRTADLAGLIEAPVGSDHPPVADDGLGPTADVAARETWADLAEWDYGDLEGLTTPKIRESMPGWTVWTGEIPGGESAEHIAARADAVLARALPALRDGDVALVGHGHFSRVLIARWLGLPSTMGAVFLVEPAGLSVLGYERDARVLCRLNLRPSDLVTPGLVEPAGAPVGLSR